MRKERGGKREERWRRERKKGQEKEGGKEKSERRRREKFKQKEKNRKGGGQGKRREARKGGKGENDTKKGKEKRFPDSTRPAAWENRAMQEIDFMTKVKNQVKNCLSQIKYFVQPENKGFVSLSGVLWFR